MLPFKFATVMLQKFLFDWGKKVKRKETLALPNYIMYLIPPAKLHIFSL